MLLNTVDGLQWVLIIAEIACEVEIALDGSDLLSTSHLTLNKPKRRTRPCVLADCAPNDDEQRNTVYLYQPWTRLVQTATKHFRTGHALSLF